MKAPFRKSNHAAVLARDLRAAKDFYETVMELELVNSTDKQLVFKTCDSFFFILFMIQIGQEPYWNFMWMIWMLLGTGW